jgi:hypothetical protein
LMRFRVSFSAREGEKKMKTKGGDFALRKRPKVSTNAAAGKMCEFISI